MKSDIKTTEDIDLLVDAFYSSVQSSDTMSPFFASLDWDLHLPKMKAFWRFILLDQEGYTTNVTEKHLNMPLNQEHFSEWLGLFNQSVDGLFEGEKSELAKERAKWIAFTIQSKMGLFKN